MASNGEVERPRRSLAGASFGLRFPDASSALQLACHGPFERLLERTHQDYRARAAQAFASKCPSHTSAPHPPPTKGSAPLSRRSHRVSELSEANVGSTETTSVPCAEATLADRSAYRSLGGARPALKSSDALRQERAQALPPNEAFAEASLTQYCLLMAKNLAHAL